MTSKQIILVRKDIKMPKGKLAAQVAHASLAPILQLFREGNMWYQDDTFASREECIDDWLNGSFTKVCLGVPNLQAMLDIHATIEMTEIPHSLILDEGRTIFKEPTYTCCGIGPWYSEQIDEITGDLKLL